MFAEPCLPDEVYIFISDGIFDIEELHQLAGLLNELVVVVVDEEELEQLGPLHPLLEPIVLEDEVVLLADRVYVADALQLPLEVGTTDHLQRELQL
jgi:hypothetical protein